MTDFSMLTDEEIIRAMAKGYEQMRLGLELSEAEVCARGGASKDAIHRFKNGKNINIKNFIAILRGVGKVGALAALFPEQETFSPLPQKQKKVKKRIFKKHTKQEMQSDFVWGEDA